MKRSALYSYSKKSNFSRQRCVIDDDEEEDYSDDLTGDVKDTKIRDKLQKTERNFVEIDDYDFVSDRGVVKFDRTDVAKKAAELLMVKELGAKEVPYVIPIDGEIFYCTYFYWR